jgi:hypothetical protein
MAVKVVSGARYLTLGRCLFLLVTSVALGETIGQLLFRFGIPRTVSLIGFSLEWTGGLIAVVFLVAFHLFSSPVEGAA